ncbi:hypothetical protein PGB90_007986 [Kerria lacca]
MTTSKLNETKVKEGVENLFKILQQHKNFKKKSLLSKVEPIFLQIDFIKVPNVKKTIVRIPLEHSLVTNTSEVCLIVADLIRGRKVNHEMTINRYKKILEKKGITDVQRINIVPSRQIRVEYSEFEARRKLCNMFDIFLIDNKISSYLLPKLGQPFYRTRKWPIPIRIKRKNLKDEILSKLKKSSMALNGYGTSKVMQVGHINMSIEEITDNIISVENYISTKFPGGWDNIRSLHLKGLRSAAIPIYMSLISANDVKKPVLKTRKRKAILAEDELTTIGKKVTVYRDGTVKIHKK